MLQNKFKILIGIFAIVILVGVFNFSLVVKAATITIPDTNLNTCIRTALGGDFTNPEIPITDTDALTLTSLDCHKEWNTSAENKITDLTGLESFTNLTYINLGWNNVSDLSPLSNLTSLNDLAVYGNSISDISPLSGLVTSLTRLNLSTNQISNISLLSNFHNLVYLSLGENPIANSDISALGGLTSLTGLQLYNNSISDISHLSNLTSLQSLSLQDNPISDISILSNFTNLTSLYLGGHAISNLNVLSSLTNLTFLSLNIASVSNISFLNTLTNLISLQLYGNSITDISLLQNFHSLNWLDLTSNNISDISSLVANTTGINNGDQVYLTGNSLNSQADVDALTARGVTVNYDTISLRITGVQTFDTNGNGYLDAVKIVFSKNIDDSNLSVLSFDVAGVTGEAVSSTMNGDSTDDNVVYLTFNDNVLNSGQTPLVKYLPSGLIDDLADGNTTNKWVSVNGSGTWNTYNGGDSAVDPIAISSPGYGGTDYAARVTGTFSSGWLGMEIPLDQGWTPFDLSSCTGIEFDAKGNGTGGTYKIQLNSQLTINAGYNHYKNYFNPGSEWAHYQLSFANDFAQDSGTQVSKLGVLQSIKSINFEVAGSGIPSVDLWVDNLKFYGCSNYSDSNINLTDLSGNAAATSSVSAIDNVGPAIIAASINGAVATVIFSESTNEPTINSGNINTVLALNNGHTWLDGSGAISSATWTTSSTLVITLSNTDGNPTVYFGDTITLDGSTITDGVNHSSTSTFSAIAVNHTPVAGFSTTPVEATNGTSLVTVTTTVYDEDNNINSLNVYYSTNNGNDWSLATLGSIISSTLGTPTTSTGSISGITATAATNTVVFTWNSLADGVTSASQTKIKIISNDGTVNGEAAISGAFVVDNVIPTISSFVTYDFNNNGYLDAVKVIFNKNIVDSTVSSTNFNVLGVGGESFSSTANGDTSNDNVIYITFNDNVLLFSQTPTVKYNLAGMIDDISENTNTNKWGGDWGSYNDRDSNGNSTVWPDRDGAFVMSTSGYDGVSDYAARMTGVVTTQFQYGYVGMASNLSDPIGSTDLRSCQGVRFDAKGNSDTYRIQLKGYNVNTSDDDYEYLFTPTDSWAEYSLPFTSFTQEGWGTQVDRQTVLQNLKQFVFQTVGQPHASVDLWVDNLEIYGCSTYPDGRTDLADAFGNKLVASSTVALSGPGGSTPVTPTNTVFSAVTTSSITFGWDAVANAMSYTVSTSASSSPVVVSSTSTIFTNLATSTIYYFKVLASNGYGSSDYSELISTTTLANPVTTYTLTYTAGSHGSLSGILSQVVDYHSTGSAVTAVPDSGYHFVNWSDDITSNPRTDSNVTQSLSVVANFAVNPPSGGGGSSGAAVAPPVLASNPVVLFNRDNTLSIGFNISNVKQIAIADNVNFIGFGWEFFDSTKNYILENKFSSSTKNLYIKFRAPDGSESKVQVIALPSEQKETGNPTTAVVSDKLLFTKILKIGTTDQEVKQLQTILKNLGYFTYPSITNYFGSFTKAALVKYQKTNGLNQTGVTDQPTKDSLNSLKVKVEKTIKYRFNNLLKYGQQGEEVKQLQIRLQELGYLATSITPNGIFGPATKAAVIKLQKEHKLAPAVGYTGPGTRDLLNN